jgi:hypothetical protein
LEDLKVIPVIDEHGTITVKLIEDVPEEQVIEYIEGLIGYVIIENLNLG